MKQYAHEYRQDRDKQLADNTVWPLMSTEGIDFDDCKSYLSNRDLSFTLAEALGWYPSRNAGDNFLRIVIPALTTKVGHVYWQARAVSPNVNLRYQSPKGPRHGALIYVRTFLEDKNSQEVVVVEGPMDALAAADCGYDSIALMGINPGEKALEHLVKLVAGRKALIVLDNELEAQSQAVVIALRLASSGGRAHVAKLKHLKDLASMAYSARYTWLAERML